MWTLLLCFLFVIIWLPGIAVFFYEENDTEDLWIPKGSQALEDSKWVSDNFPTNIRVESVYVIAPNVLLPSVLQDVSAFC